MKVRAITTCHAAGWEQYGRRMAQTWAQHWPVPLTMWTEGFACDVPGVTVHDLGSIEWLAEFKRAHRGKMPPGPYNYRFDAVRFAHKTAAVIQSALDFDCDHLIWVDADTLTHAPVPADFVRSLLPHEPEFIAWLDREGNYPECGFYVLNLRHPLARYFVELLRDWHTDGTLFRLSEWHDSFVLQKFIEHRGIAWKSLSGPRARRTGHPFVNGPLGAYMDHLKGERKHEGKSRRKDLKVHRTENYWRNVR